ncbi:MAG: helix-turn-helix domain-containing protein [Sphingorhabdus sp.]
MTIGQRFFEIRRRAGETQTEFAAKLGISQSALVTYERNDRDPPASAMVSLCKKYGVSPTWLLMGNGIPHRANEIETMEMAVNLAKDFTLKYSVEPNRNDEVGLAKLYFQYLLENGDISNEMADLLATRRAVNE